MPNATIKISDEEVLHLFFTFSCTTQPSTLATSQFPPTSSHVHKHERGVAYTLRPQRGHKPPALWILGKGIEFNGRIGNNGSTGQLQAWTAGVIQTIHKSERNALYHGGAQRRLRLNTTGGPLKDGDDDEIFYPGSETGGSESITVDADDAPNFEPPLKYGLHSSPLVSTSGSDRFSTHLVLVREKTIVRLACIDWKIDWSGKFDWKEQTWTPASDQFLWWRRSETPLVFANLNTNPQHTPFSLVMAEAEGFCEISNTGSPWQRCNMRGDTSKGRNPSRGTWRTA